MKEVELRKLIREEIKKSMNELDLKGTPTFFDKIGSGIRSRLGSGKSILNRVLGQIDGDRVAKLPVNQKVELVVALMDEFGINASTFNLIKQRVIKKLGTGAEQAPVATTESKKPKK